MGKKEGTKVEYILATRNTSLKKYHLATIAFRTENKLDSHLRGSIVK